MPGNRKLWKLLTLAQAQWMVSFGGVSGLKFEVIIDMAPAWQIKTDEVFFEKLSAYELEALKIFRDNEDKGECDEKQKELCKLLYGEYLAWNCEQKLCGKD